MGTINKKDFAGIIGNYDDGEHIRFCPHCLEFNLYNELGPRIYEILKPNQKPKPLPRDADEWLQCNKPNRGCGRIFAKYQSKIEAGIGDMIESESNPHDIGHSVIGIGNKRKKTDIQKQHDRLLKQIDSVKDPDIKKELRKGIIVEYDSGDYF